MDPRVKQLAVNNVLSGMDPVPAIVLAVFKVWPCDNPGMCEGDCHSCNEYTRCAPDVKALEQFRDAIGTREIGSWSFRDPHHTSAAWCLNHDRDDAIAIINDLSEVY
jgi:hypothetical protein